MINKIFHSTNISNKVKETIQNDKNTQSYSNELRMKKSCNLRQIRYN